MGNLNNLVLYAVFTAIFFYLLYGVIRAGVRDGILAAARRRVAATSDQTGAEPSASRRQRERDRP
ncbi:hypothetical protein [Citricoccus muralis]|uniref:Uncharacterized protein n=1 Tax=Citricoccus muralis TaxID=169134 RepID=A0A3D9LBM0_9MICC|nr:hypothetical protein [Citricoccus muralis]REE03260.1 hypothetical protein C8E99_1067 [Citricoccus muralis]